MVHGGEIYDKKEIRYDFSVNINPLGIPSCVKEELAAVIFGAAGKASCLEQYPDQNCTELREALSIYTGVQADHILCGNGASELIEAAVRAIRPESILLTAPSFSGYRHAAEGAGVRILYHELRREEDFRLTERYLEALDQLKQTVEQRQQPEDRPKEPPDRLKQAKDRSRQPEDRPKQSKDRLSQTGKNLRDPGTRPGMAILCNPANPVGNTIEPDLLDRIVEKCGREGIWLLIDECFIGFLKDGNRRTARKYFAAEKAETGPAGAFYTGTGRIGLSGACRTFPGGIGPERLLVLDAFTKRFAMPGIRLGYLMAQNTDLLKKIRAQQPEWSVSLPAQKAGAAAVNADLPRKPGTAADPGRTVDSGTAIEPAVTYMDRARALVAAEREKMRVALQKLGFKVFPGEANFIFFSVAKPAGQGEADLQTALLKKGILIRSCENYVGLRKGDYRIAVLSPEKNAALVRALEEICS